MATAIQKQIDKTTGVTRQNVTQTYRDNLKRQMRNHYRRKSMGGNGG